MPKTPQNLNLERAVLGASLAFADVVIPSLIDEGVTEDSFFLAWHREVWTAMLALRGAGSLVDPLTVAQHFRDEKRMQAIDSLAGWATEATAASKARYYGRLLVDLEEWRATLVAGLELVEAAGRQDERRRAKAWGSLCRLHAQRRQRAAKSTEGDRPRLQEAKGSVNAS